MSSIRATHFSMTPTTSTHTPVQPESAAQYSPTKVNIALMDFQPHSEGATPYNGDVPPHVVFNHALEGGYLNDDANTVTGREFIRFVRDEMRRREDMLQTSGSNDINAYRGRGVLDEELEPLPHLVVIVDNAYDYTGMAYNRDSREVLSEILRKGRSLGVHVLAVDQAGTYWREESAQITYAVAFKCSKPQSRVALNGDPSASTLTGGTGEALVWRTSDDEHEEPEHVQVLRMEDNPRSVRARMFEKMKAVADSWS